MSGYSEIGEMPEEDISKRIQAFLRASEVLTLDPDSMDEVLAELTSDYVRVGEDPPECLYDVLFVLTSDYISLGLFENAANTLRQMIELRPKDSFTHFSLGRAYEALQSWHGAELAYAEALRIDPNNPDARSGIERVRLRL